MPVHTGTYKGGDQEDCTVSSLLGPNKSAVPGRRLVSQLDLLWNEMETMQGGSHHGTFDIDMDDEDDENDDSWEDDVELMQRTEGNRHIPLEEDNNSKTERQSQAALHQAIFSEQVVQRTPERIVRTQYYGTDKTDQPPGSKPVARHRIRSYMVACDLSSESLLAARWTMETMMRDGDELHIATVVPSDDHPDAGKTASTLLANELEMKSETMTLQIKSILCDSLLRDIKLITYTMTGRVKRTLKNLIHELRLTLVVCGDRGRGTVKELLMGSVSMYLVFVSPVPVSVVRPMKTKTKKHPIIAHTPMDVIRRGHLQVDELSAHA